MSGKVWRDMRGVARCDVFHHRGQHLLLGFRVDVRTGFTLWNGA